MRLITGMQKRTQKVSWRCGECRGGEKDECCYRSKSAWQADARDDEKQRVGRLLKLRTSPARRVIQALDGRQLSKYIQLNTKFEENLKVTIRNMWQLWYKVSVIFLFF